MRMGRIVLPNGNITSVEVLNSSTAAPYNAGTDYTLNTVAGVISINPGGSDRPGRGGEYWKQLRRNSDRDTKPGGRSFNEPEADEGG